MNTTTRSCFFALSFAMTVGLACGVIRTDQERATSAATHRVSSIADLRARIASANPGDVIVLANGSYTTTSNTQITRAGTASAPIIVTAETIGGVEIRGTHGITFGNGAAHAQIRGFRFRHAASVHQMSSGTHHCRYTRNVFELTGEGSYLSVSGNDHEVDHNLFQNKSTEGMMLSIQGPGGNGMAQRTWVHHNHFRNFTPGGANNFETIRVGLSGRSLSDAHSLFEHNLFSECNGENELISNKSGANTYRYNTIRDSRGSLTLRHGNKALVYGNYLINTDGIRFFGDDHKIFGNYLRGNSPAIQVGNGDGEVADGDNLTSHDRPDRVEVSFNTLVDNQVNIEMSGRTDGMGATDLVVANNIIRGGGDAANIRGPLPGATWRGNILSDSSRGDMPPGGGRSVDPRLVTDRQGVHRLQAGSPAIDAASGSHPSPAVDMDGQMRGSARDVGADELGDGPVVARLLGPEDVGPSAPEDAGTPAPSPTPNPNPNPNPGGRVAAPVFTPAGGSFAGPVTVRMASSTAGAAISYTTDGSTPSDTAGILYTGPILLDATSTLRAVAVVSGPRDGNVSLSEVTSAEFVIGAGGGMGGNGGGGGGGGGGATIEFEAESLGVTHSGTGTSVDADPSASGGAWLALQAENAGSWMELTTPAIPAGSYDLSLAWKGNDSRGIASVRVDGQSLVESLDQYSEDGAYQTTALGAVAFASDGAHLIRIKVIGKNPSSTGYLISADRLIFVRR